MSFNLAPSVRRISKQLKSQENVLGCLRILCQMRAPIELLRQFEIQKLVKNIISLRMSSEISNLAKMVDMKIQKMEDLESEKQKRIEEEFSSKVFMEKVLSFKWIHPSKFVRTRKYSCDSVSTSSSSSSSTSPTHVTEDAQDVPSESEHRRQEKKIQRRLECEFEFKKNREDRKRAMQMEKEEEKVERKTKKRNDGRVLYRPY